MIVKCYLLHKLHLGFVNDFFSPISLSCLIDFKIIHLHKSVHDIVDLNFDL